MPRARFSPLALSLASALAGCGPGTARPDDPPPPPASAPPEPLSPWQLLPTLRRSAPPGVAVEPAFELADGHRGKARVGVAALAPDAPLRLEVWEFDQNNPRDQLERVGPARVLWTVGGPADADAFAELRRAVALPGSTFVRPRGLPGEPAALLARLGELAGVVRDPQAAPEARVEALARLTSALDDHVLLDPDSLPGLLAALAEGPWIPAEVAPVGERRRTISLEGKPHRVELARTGEQWVVSELKLAHSASSAPTAEPSPTAP